MTLCSPGTSGAEWLAVGTRAHDAATGRSGTVQLLQHPDAALHLTGDANTQRVLLRPYLAGQPWWAQPDHLTPTQP